MSSEEDKLRAWNKSLEDELNRRIELARRAGCRDQDMKRIADGDENTLLEYMMLGRYASALRDCYLETYSLPNRIDI